MNTNDRRVTIVSLFSEAGQDGSTELNNLVTSSGVLKLVPRAGPAGPLVSGPVAAALAKVLDQNLGDPILWAWRTHRDLKEAATATLAGTGPAEHVSLASHKISSVHHPEVDVTVDGQAPVTITFDLTLLFTLDALLLTVQRGLLVGLSPAGCSVTMTFGAHGINTTRSHRYTLPELIHIQTGLRLLPKPAYATADDIRLTG
jgi:hypothetical protein